MISFILWSKGGIFTFSFLLRISIHFSFHSTIHWQPWFFLFSSSFSFSKHTILLLNAQIPLVGNMDRVDKSRFILLRCILRPSLTYLRLWWHWRVIEIHVQCPNSHSYHTRANHPTWGRSFWWIVLTNSLLQLQTEYWMVFSCFSCRRSLDRVQGTDSGPN